MVRYDAAVIGAGVEGLAAAITLADAGLSVVVVDRGAQPGGRLVPHEFHPGFRAAPFCDSLRPVPASLYRTLGVARSGAGLVPVPASVALWPDGQSIIGRGAGASAAALFAEASHHADAALAWAAAEAARAPLRFKLQRSREPSIWPASDWADQSLSGLVRERIAEPRLAAHALAVGLGARGADPGLAGSALQLLAACDGGVPLGGFAAALSARAQAAGVVLAMASEVAEIRLHRGRAAGLGLSDGRQIDAGAVISTLDLKQTFLAFFAWNVLPKDLVRRAGAFRMGPGTARLLVALDAPPALSPVLLRSPIHVMPEAGRLAEVHAAARTGTVPAHPPMIVRFVSAADPALAPAGKATMTVTLGAIPRRLFDGAWTHEKRDALRSRALTAVEAVLPDLSARILAVETIVPPDIEQALGATGGDFCAGEIAADQMLALRPGLGCAGLRTPLAGLYLAGGSTMAGVLASGASGAFAARTLLADRSAGRLG